MATRISRSKVLREWKLYLFALPALMIVLTFSYFPAVSGLYHSFFHWNGGDTKEFVGLGNFERILTDKVFHQSFVIIFILVLANFFKLIPSIFTAVLIHRVKSDRAQYWYRVAVVVPMIVPSIVVLFIWKFFYDPNLGILNKALEATGLKSALVSLDSFFGWGVFLAEAPISWLGTPELVLPALIFWGFPWLGAVGVLIYLSGLEKIDSELYDAAEIDGAGAFQKFWHVELPLIVTQIRLTMILLIISTLQGYGQQYLLLGENGGPGRAGMTPGLWMFNRSFFNGEFGYACALGLVIFFVILFLTLINNKFVRVDK